MKKTKTIDGKNTIITITYTKEEVEKMKAEREKRKAEMETKRKTK